MDSTSTDVAVNQNSASTGLSEDWIAIAAASILTATVAFGWNTTVPSLSWSNLTTLQTALSAKNLKAIAAISVCLALVSSALFLPSLKSQVLRFLPGLLCIVALGWLAQLLAANSQIKGWGIEYVVFALSLGLIWRNIAPVPAWIQTSVKTEFWIKVGIIILGTSIHL